MKKNILVIILLAIAVLSCGGKEKMGFDARDRLNKETAEKIIECLNQKDTDGLYNLFSEEVKNNDPYLKDNIQKIINYLNGNVESYEKWSVSSTTSIEKGQNATYYYSSFKLKINNIEYFMYYIYYPKNDFQLTESGLKSLKIVKVEEDDKYSCYWQDMEPGVFLPDEAK